MSNEREQSLFELIRAAEAPTTADSVLLLAKNLGRLIQEDKIKVTPAEFIEAFGEGFDNKVFSFAGLYRSYFMVQATLLRYLGPTFTLILFSIGALAILSQARAWISKIRDWFTSVGSMLNPIGTLMGMGTKVLGAVSQDHNLVRDEAQHGFTASLSQRGTLNDGVDDVLVSSLDGIIRAALDFVPFPIRALVTSLTSGGGNAPAPYAPSGGSSFGGSGASGSFSVPGIVEQTVKNVTQASPVVQAAKTGSGVVSTIGKVLSQLPGFLGSLGGILSDEANGEKEEEIEERLESVRDQAFDALSSQDYDFDRHSFDRAFDLTVRDARTRANTR